MGKLDNAKRVKATLSGNLVFLEISTPTVIRNRSEYRYMYSYLNNSSYLRLFGVRLVSGARRWSHDN